MPEYVRNLQKEQLPFKASISGYIIQEATPDLT